jgi:hypothetical protein
MKHIMVDLETLGTAADAVILSIGAVRFDLESEQMDDAGFYASISIESNLAAGRRIQEDTLCWWLKQSAAAQQVFHEPKIELHAALDNFAEWVGDPTHFMWSNGADFDLPMLAHAYRQASCPAPWRFYDSRCMRTYKNLPQAKTVSVKRIGVHHNALSDAIYQACAVQAIHKELTKKVK